MLYTKKFTRLYVTLAKITFSQTPCVIPFIYFSERTFYSPSFKKVKIVGFVFVSFLF